MSDVVDVYDSEYSDDEAEAKCKDYGNLDLGGHLEGYDEDDAEQEDGDFEEGVKGCDNTPSSNLRDEMVSLVVHGFEDEEERVDLPVHHSDVERVLLLGRKQHSGLV